MSNDRSALLRLLNMKHSPLRNYIVPGLTSWMISPKADETGCVRLFEMDREQHMAIAPHSHRFDFECYVVRGAVSNIIWREWTGPYGGDEMVETDLIYTGKPGQYRLEQRPNHNVYKTYTYRYKEGDWYGMKSYEIHSIVFDKGSLVLFFEGPQLKDRSMILEPFSAGHHVKQAATLPWMFLKSAVVDDHFA